MKRENILKFEWDIKKEIINIQKHGIDFSTASLVFKDVNRVEIYDELHSTEEDRYIAIGMVDGFVFLINVVFTERGDVLRIISARRATKREEDTYYDGSQRN